MKVQTKDLIGQALDWAVEVAKGSSVYMRHDFMRLRHSYLQSSVDLFWHLTNQDNDPIIGDILTGETRFLPKNSTDWSQGGPIIDLLVQEGMSLLSREYLSLAGRHNLPSESTYCEAHLNFIVTSGPTPLIAAMRCLVASKLGDEVEIPDALLNL